ncbi:MAG: tagaturonate reductase, partial [Armatimonadota bacterium]
GEILKLAELPGVDVVVSNTTEVGIAVSPNDAFESSPPESFPGKLAAWLWHRFRTLGDADESQVLVLPCELIDNNGDVLQACVEELAHRWELPLSFAQWLRGKVTFCNTLVDRIVTGFPLYDELEAIEVLLGYKDELLNVCEPYHLWAVQAGPDTAERFPLHKAGLNVIYTSNITPYRDKKVRLLNGTHSLTAPVAVLAGCVFVRDAVKHPLVSAWMRKMLMTELAASLTYPRDEVEQYAVSVLERFGNPNLRHRWEHILTNTLVKLRIRVVPSVISYAAKNGRSPDLVAFGFAGLIAAVSRGERHGDAVVFPTPLGTASMRDPEAAQLCGALSPAVCSEDAYGLADRLLSDQRLWGADLSVVPGFARAVGGALADICTLGVEGALDKLLRRFPMG